MALKPILSVDIDDAQFKEFAALFAKYRDQLQKMPEDWKKINESIKSVGTSFGDYEERIKALEAKTKGMEKSRDDRSGDAERSVSIWQRVSIATGAVATNLDRATGHLLKWSVITGAFMGLIGAGSLFGIDRWASTIAARRSSALGLGISYGAQSAFGINLQRFVDPAVMLGNVNRASLDFTSPGFIALMNSTGLSANRLASLNSAQLSLLVLQNLPRMLGSNIMQKPGMLGPMMETYGLTNFLGVEDAARYMRAKPEERAQIIQAAQANIKNQDLTAQAQLAWTNFSTQMQRASGALEKVFAESLKNLAGLLAQLSHAIVDAVANLLRSDAIKRWIKLAATGLESLAKYVKTPQFEKDVSDWVKGISDFIRSLSDMMGGFEGIEHALTALDELLNRLAYYGTTAPSLAEQWKSYTENMPEAHGGGPGGVGVVGKWWTKDRILDTVRALMKGGLTREGAIAMVATASTIEAGGGPDAINPTSGAFGLWQWLGPRKTPIAYNTDPSAQIAYAIKELKTTEQKSGAVLTTTHDINAAAQAVADFERGGYGPSAILPGAQRVQRMVDDDDAEDRRQMAASASLGHPARQALRFRHPKLRLMLQQHDNPALAAAQAAANSYPVSGAGSQ